MLPRILEPELMDTDDDARQYDAMDHTAVNEIFVTDLSNALTDWSLQRPVQNTTTPLNVLDLGAGTALIPIELARRASHIRIAAAGLAARITPFLADAKQLPFDSASFPCVISNSIIHHIPEPREALREAVRVTAPGGLLFHRDLCRPRGLDELNRLVDTYAAGANAYQRKLFADSLHAALTVEEIGRLIADLGFAAETVRMTSDRHWTWIATKN